TFGTNNPVGSAPTSKRCAPSRPSRGSARPSPSRPSRPKTPNPSPHLKRMNRAILTRNPTRMNQVRIYPIRRLRLARRNCPAPNPPKPEANQLFSDVVFFPLLFAETQSQHFFAILNLGVIPMPDPLSPEELQLMDAYWRAANYLSVGQIYLYANPLLTRPLTIE